MDCSDPYILANKLPPKEKPIPNDMLQMIIQRESLETDTTPSHFDAQECDSKSLTSDSDASSGSDSSIDDDSSSESGKDSTRTDIQELASISFNVSLSDNKWV